jgi:tetratricopeptide (TPR) repeat protein
VQALAPEETQVTPRLAALVRRDLVRPDRPQLPHEDAYRFRHLLIRDAAYDALPKATRADLHERFAEWLQEHGDELVELDEILGYHLEQAALYLGELGTPDPALADEASRRLGAAGERMYWRGDRQAAHSLLRRAVELVDEPEVHLAVRFALSHIAAHDAEPLLDEAARRAEARADAAGAAFARGIAAQMRLLTGEVTNEEAEQLLRAALPLLEARQDHAALAQIWFSLANGPYNFSGRNEQALQATERARDYETLAGLPHQRADFLHAFALVFGPCPVAEALTRLETLTRSGMTDMPRAILLAMSDKVAEARELARSAEEYARERGGMPHQDLGEFEDIVGDHEAAAEQYAIAREWISRHVRSGEIGYALTQEGRELALAGRYEEAEERLAQSREHRQRSRDGEALRLQLTALVAAHRGEHADAELLAREALTHILETDSPKLQGDTYCDLAEVLEAAGRRDEAVAAWQEALDRYERKGVIPLARRVRERLALLEPA